MSNVKVWMGGMFLAMAVAGTAYVVGLPTAAQAEPKEEMKDHWRHHDGHWSYWNAEDKQWYYTDGTHWFFNDGRGWETYRFDKKFGREGFERGEYKVPPPDAKIERPRHEVWHR